MEGGGGCNIARCAQYSPWIEFPRAQREDHRAPMSRSRALSNAWNLQFELCRISPRRSFRNSPGHSQIYTRGTFKIQGKLYLAMESVNRRFDYSSQVGGGDIGSFRFSNTRVITSRRLLFQSSVIENPLLE